MKENGENVEEELDRGIDDSRVHAICTALDVIGLVPNPSLPVPILQGPTPTVVYENWAAYPGYSSYPLNQACMIKLKELYELGKNDKKKRVSAE